MSDRVRFRTQNNQSVTVFWSFIKVKVLFLRIAQSLVKQLDVEAFLTESLFDLGKDQVSRSTALSRFFLSAAFFDKVIVDSISESLRHDRRCVSIRPAGQQLHLLFELGLRYGASTLRIDESQPECDKIVH